MPYHPVHPSAAVRPAAPPASGAYLFEDDFTGAAGTAPDSSKWAYDLGAGSVVGGNSETEIYTDSTANAYLDGKSHLVIAVTESGGRLYSARLKTLGKYTQLFGSWQASIAIRDTPGCWPAFWLLGERGSWPACGEADVMEAYGSGFTEGTVWNSTATEGVCKRALSAVGTDYHTYQMDTSPSAIRYFVDGVLYLSATPATVQPWPFNSNGGLYAILNIATNGTGTGGISPALSSLPVTMSVDYVRAWT